jgi:UPF0755 protein
VRRLLGWLLLAFVAVVVTGGLVVWLTLYRPVYPPRPATVVSIAEGMRFTDVARQLARDGLVRWVRPVVLYARWTGADRRVSWGEYDIRGPVRPVDLVARLAGPPSLVRRVTVPEGLTTAETARLLADAGLGSAESFRCLLADPRFLAAFGLPAAGAEGYLFPDTYPFPRAASPMRILGTMIARFRAVVTPDIAARAKAHGLTLEQAVVLASMIEEETSLPDERRLISAVFQNRLHLGMRLQSDPTVLYGRADPTDRRITRADLRRATPHNTYVISGLPPTPISSPGLASIEAAVDPAPVDYLYFVARGDGSHQFSRTLGAHRRAVARYILRR